MKTFEQWWESLPIAVNGNKNWELRLAGRRYIQVDDARAIWDAIHSAVEPQAPERTVAAFNELVADGQIKTPVTIDNPKTMETVNPTRRFYLDDTTVTVSDPIKVEPEPEPEPERTASNQMKKQRTAQEIQRFYERHPEVVRSFYDRDRLIKDLAVFLDSAHDTEPEPEPAEDKWEPWTRGSLPWPWPLIDVESNPGVHRAITEDDIMGVRVSGIGFMTWDCLFQSSKASFDGGTTWGPAGRRVG